MKSYDRMHHKHNTDSAFKWYVNGMGVEALASIFSTTQIDSKAYCALAELGHQIQTQVIFYLDRQLECNHNSAYVFYDSPWFLMSRIESTFWGMNTDIVSVGIGIWNRPGTNGKTAETCTKQEIADECRVQLAQAGIVLPEDCHWDMWDDFETIEMEGEKVLYTTEPKFSNNVGTLALRPHVRDKYLTNLVHATAYARTGMNIFNMESAVEAAIASVAVIRDKNEQNALTKHNPNLFWRCVRAMDRVAYAISGSCSRREE